MSNPLQKIVLITGATAGIGKATAKAFAKQGFDLILTGRRANRLEELKERFTRKYAIDVKTLNFDVSNRKQVKKALNSLEGRWNNVDLLINNAGLALGADKFHQASLDDWETMIDTNVKGILYMSKIISQQMVKNGSGHIINVCSTAGHEVYPTGNVYCASKHAVGAITKAMRMDLFDKGIRVSQISPGAVEETEFSLVRYKGDKEKARIYEGYNPLTSKDVAKAIQFIASQPKHVTIHDVVLTGTQQASAIIFDKSGRTDR